MELFLAGDEVSRYAQLSIKFGYCHYVLSLLFCYFINTTTYLWVYKSLHLPFAIILPDQMAGLEVTLLSLASICLPIYLPKHPPTYLPKHPPSHLYSLVRAGRFPIAKPNHLQI